METIIERYRAARHDPDLAVLEGLHALKHALRFDARIEDVRTPDPGALRALAEALAPDVADRIATRAAAVTGDVFADLAPAPHPTGAIALAGRPRHDLTDVLDRDGPAPLVLLERPTHHGNIGAVVRVAAAAGAAGVLVTGPHDPWHPASIRGAAGLQFALPVMRLERRGVELVVASGRPVVALDPAGEPVGAPGTRLPPGAVLVFGSERTGVSAELLDRADRKLAIPMRAGVSSLNLATAAAVALYLTGGDEPSSGSGDEARDAHFPRDTP